ncbi:MAG TPA: DUF3536 domain-containing protein [Blastocatellia bacterium]|nr:DUF3536 domain-containing protein [Blastocatellia bacterium]
MSRYICIHGHFYQPPRENPWLEAIELQDSAYPYHDWNARITAECYATNAASRLLDAGGKILDIVNNYSKISFNFGPTLLLWMEVHAPDVYRAILEADKLSQQNFNGHGSAMAQVYNHMIMPLSNTRDKVTQIVWGIADFEHRFGRKPEGMWLAETAVDTETLELLAEHGIKFTILAPRQARRVRNLGEEEWRDVSDGRIDPKVPYLCALPSGKTITLFFYDGPISQELAFAGLLDSGEALANRLLGAFNGDDPQDQMVHIATDGETYGHHHRYGDMALAYCLHHLETNDLAKITIYPQFMEIHPPTQQVEIVENTSWSCVHGIERWRNNCGCNSGTSWVQEWRSPLREALDWLRDKLAGIYEDELGRYADDPWRMRNDYINVILNRSEDNVNEFFSRHTSRELSQDDKVKVLRLLELQRHALLMYTSCGWFFDEISGLEATQVLQYAARAIQLADKAAGANLESSFLEILQRAPSNLPQYQNGAHVYESLVKPAMVDLLRVGAHYAVSSLFEDYSEDADIYCYSAHRKHFEVHEAGRQRLAVGTASLRSYITNDERTISFAVLHLGDHNLIGGVREFIGEETFTSTSDEIKEAFLRSDIPDVIREIDRNYEGHNYSLWHLFRDEQRKVFNRILQSTLEEIEGSFRQIYDHHYPIMQVMRELNVPLPKALATPAEYTVSANLKKTLEASEIDLNQLQNLIDEIAKWNFESEKTTLGYVASQRVTELMRDLEKDPENLSILTMVEGILRILRAPAMHLDLMKAQNLHFRIAREHYNQVREKADSGDEAAKEWVERFDVLGTYLQIRSA